jgi:hypothetical protein
MKPCKHLDHSSDFVDCKLVEINDLSVPVKYWERLKPPYEGAPINVQFCGLGKGRINGIFQCYNEGEMGCYCAEEVSA